MLLLLVAHQVEHAVRHHDVYAGVWDQRSLAAQAGLLDFEGVHIIRAEDGVDLEPGLYRLEVERQILDPRPAKLHVPPADAAPYLILEAPRQPQHLRVHVDADHSPLRTDHLAGDIADLPAAGPKVEDGITPADVAAGIPASVVPFDDFLRDDFQVARIVIDRATEIGLLTPCAVAVARTHDTFDVESSRRH